MENLLLKLRERYQDLGEKDRAVAEFILRSEQEVPRLTISQVAEGSGVSQAAVVRFASCLTARGLRISAGGSQLIF